MKLSDITTSVGELARPCAILGMTGAGMWTTIDVGHRVTSGDAWMFITAVMAGVTGLYVGKAIEVTRVAGHQAEVDKIKAANPAPVIVATDSGELPPDQRVRR